MAGRLSPHWLRGKAIVQGRLNIGGVAIDARLVCPLPRAQAPLDVDVRSLVQVLKAHLSLSPKQHHAVPLGRLSLFAGCTVTPLVSGGQPEVADGCAVGEDPRLRLRTKMSDQYDAIDRRHDAASLNMMLNPII